MPETLTPTAIPTDVTSEAETEWAQPAVAVREKPAGPVRRAAERGMVTAEYAIGILAAIALALTLAKFLTGSEFITKLTVEVGKMIGQVASTIKVK